MSSYESKGCTLRTGETVTLRSATPADAAAILEFVAEVLSSADHVVTQADEFRLSDEEEAKWIQDHSDAPGHLCLLACCGDTVVGLLTVEAGNRRRIAHCGTMAVSIRSTWRRNGIGTLLIRACLEWAHQNAQIEKVCLAVLATNTAALELYRRLGFIEEGRQFREIRFGPGSYVDEILMYRWVK